MVVALVGYVHILLTPVKSSMIHCLRPQVILVPQSLLARIVYYILWITKRWLVDISMKMRGVRSIWEVMSISGNPQESLQVKLYGRGNETQIEKAMELKKGG